MSKKVTNLRAILETSLEATTKRVPGDANESLGISPYLLIWYLAILFFILQSGAQHNTEKPEVDIPAKI